MQKKKAKKPLPKRTRNKKAPTRRYSFPCRFSPIPTAANTAAMGLLLLGEYAGKEMGRTLREKYKLKQQLDAWIKTKPKLGNYGEHGFLHFTKSFFGNLIQEMFKDTATTIDLTIASVYGGLNTIHLRSQTSLPPTPPK